MSTTPRATHTPLPAGWSERRTYGAESIPTTTALAACKTARNVGVTVAVTTREDAPTIGAVVDSIRSALVRTARIVDEILVVDRGSADATTRIAAEAGAHVVTRTAAGRGDALWHSIAAARGGILVRIGGDLDELAPRIVTRLVAPLLLDRDLVLVKGFDGHRASEVSPKSGGWTGSSVRPLLAAFFPELDGFVDPCSLETAGRVGVLRRLPVWRDDAADVAMLLDCVATAGLERLGQVNLGSGLPGRFACDAGGVAHEVGRAIVRRAQEWGRIRAFADATVHPLLVRDDEEDLILPSVASLARSRAPRASEPVPAGA